jgi:hypothetical protein
MNVPNADVGLHIYIYTNIQDSFPINLTTISESPIVSVADQNDASASLINLLIVVVIR